MDNVYIKKYKDFIDTYYSLYHLQNTELEEVYDLILNVLIFKYKIHLPDLFVSIFTAIQFNFRSTPQYLQIPVSYTHLTLPTN